MRIEDQLRMILVDIIIMKNINDIHQCHRMNGSIKFIHDERATVQQYQNDQRKFINKPDRTVGLKHLCRQQLISKYRAKHRIFCVLFTIGLIANRISGNTELFCRLGQRGLHIDCVRLWIRKLSNQSHII